MLRITALLYFGDGRFAPAAGSRMHPATPAITVPEPAMRFGRTQIAADNNNSRESERSCDDHAENDVTLSRLPLPAPPALRFGLDYDHEKELPVKCTHEPGIDRTFPEPAQCR